LAVLDRAFLTSAGISSAGLDWQILGWRGWAGGSRAGARGKTYFCATRSEGQEGEGGRVAATPLAGPNLRLGQRGTS
jgi:hypothetical protein